MARMDTSWCRTHGRYGVCVRDFNRGVYPKSCPTCTTEQKERDQIAAAIQRGKPSQPLKIDGTL